MTDKEQLFHAVLLGAARKYAPYYGGILPYFGTKKKQAHSRACPDYKESASSQHTVAPSAPPAAYTGAGIFRYTRRQPETRRR